MRILRTRDELERLFGREISGIEGMLYTTCGTDLNPSMLRYCGKEVPQEALDKWRWKDEWFIEVELHGPPEPDVLYVETHTIKPFALFFKQFGTKVNPSLTPTEWRCALESMLAECS